MTLTVIAGWRVSCGARHWRFVHLLWPALVGAGAAWQELHAGLVARLAELPLIRTRAGQALAWEALAATRLPPSLAGPDLQEALRDDGLRLPDPDLPPRMIRAADAAGVQMVVNARTDLFLRADGDESDRVSRAVDRLTLCADAGADCLYPVGRHDPDTLRRLTSELPLPVNAIALPDQDDPASFGPLGVGRISFGPFFQAALAKRAQEILGRWG